MGIKTGGYRPIVIALGLLLFLAGCGFTPQGDAAREYIAIRGAQVADQSLQNSVWGVCKATTIGAVMRRYSHSAERMAAYMAFCYPKQYNPFEALKGALEKVFPNSDPAVVMPPVIAPFPTPAE